MVSKSKEFIIADGRKGYICMDYSSSFPLAEYAMLEESLIITEAKDLFRKPYIESIVKPIQDSWCEQLAEALDTISPGLTKQVEDLAIERQKVSWQHPPLPSPLNNQEYAILASAYLYWRTAPDGSMMPVPAIGKFSNHKWALVAPLTHPAEGHAQCPRCGQQAEVKVTVRTNKKKQPKGSLMCVYCGHHEPLEHPTPYRAHWTDSLLMQCGCTSCLGDVTKLKTALSKSFKTLPDRISSQVRQRVKELETRVARFNNAPHDPVKSSYLNALILQGVHGGKLVDMSRITDDWSTDDNKTYVKNNWSIVVELIAKYQGGAKITMEPLVDLSDPEAIIEWCFKFAVEFGWQKAKNIPETQEEFREWVKLAENCRIFDGCIALPVSMRITPLSEEDKKEPPPEQQPEQGRVQTESERILDAIAFLRDRGYRVYYSGNAF